MRRARDAFRELDCGLAGRDAAAAHPDFQLHVYIELRGGFLQPLPDRRRRPHAAATALRACSRSANHASAAATTATSTNAKILTRCQPTLVTVKPELNYEITIMMKITWSLVPCALARSSGR